MEKKRNLHIGWLVTAMVVVLLIIDQWIKLYIKTHFCLGESVRVTDWFFIDFIENNGMAGACRSSASSGSACCAL
jgi:signal peptidase II